MKHNGFKALVPSPGPCPKVLYFSDILLREVVKISEVFGIVVKCSINTSYYFEKKSEALECYRPEDKLVQ